MALITTPVYAQEALDALFLRGYVEEWLVCGPFDGGDPEIVERVSGRLLPVPDEDFLQSIGGVRRARPEEGLAVKTGTSDLAWQRLRGDRERIDFSSLIGDAAEANIYAACTIRAGQAADILIDFQTMLGARLWLNGFPVAMPAPVSPIAAGLQRHVARLRRGDNHLLMQVPLASLDAVAAAEGMSASSLRDAILATRALLANATGYEAAIRFRPAARAGQLVYVPRLVETGRFTGQGNTLAQELAIELFNPGPGSAGPTMVRARFGPGDPWIAKAVRALPPQTRVDVLFGMPLSGYKAGEVRQAEIEIETTAAKSAFASRVTVRASPSRGTAYVITGLTGPAIAHSQSVDAERRMTALSRNVTLLEYEPSYGFYLGGIEAWQPFFVMNPDARPVIRDAVTRGRIGANGSFGVPDERLVSGELFARNLLHGRQGTRNGIGLAATTYHDWQTRGIAPQSAQLLNQAKFAGRTLVALNADDRHGPYWALGLDGSRFSHWSIHPFAAPNTAADLQAHVVQAREALLGSGIDSGIYVSETADESAAVYLLNETESLREAIPSIRFEASGSDHVFESVREFGDRNSQAFPTETRLPITSSLGEVIVQRDVKDAYAYAEGLTASAERFASLAAMHGTPYPHDALDWAWRQLLFYSEPNVLGRAASPALAMDAVNGFHHVAAIAGDELDRSLTALASNINTATNTPKSTNTNSALVVFNPSFHSRTDVCEWRVPPRSGTRFAIVAEDGTPVPHRLRKASSAMFAQFVVQDLPSLGYRTYYIVPGVTAPTDHPGAPNTIENEFFRIVVDPERGGAIVNLEAKESGTGLLSGLGNDVVVLDEDPARTGGGRELWVTGEAGRASESAAQVQTLRSSVCEQMKIVSPLAGGEITRTITLYRDVPRIDCETTFRGVNALNRALAITFGTVPQGRTLITGERYGMTVNAASAEPLHPKTEDGRFHSASYPRPALRWAALSANDHLRAGANVAVPLRSAVVVYDAETYGVEAQALIFALMKRGIPSVGVSASEVERRNDLIAQGYTFLITIGGATENLVTAELIDRLDQTAGESAIRMIEAGLPTAIGNVHLNAETPLVDALILAADSIATTQTLVSQVSNAIQESGTLEMTPRAYTGPSPRPLPTRGLALLFEGTNVITQGTDGSLVLFAAHDGSWEETENENSIKITPMNFTIRYSLVPFDGDWRKAAIPARAHASTSPLRAQQTSLHLGESPPEKTFGSVSNDAFVVTAFKGAHATPGYMLRGYEAHGRPLSNSTFDIASGITRAWRSNPIEQNRNPFQVSSNGFRIELEPYSIATYAFEVPVPGGGARSSDPPITGHTKFTRYWQHNVGVAPDADPAASIVLLGDLDHDDTVTLRVVNEQTKPLEGEVQLTPSTGWTVAPETIAVALQPEESLERRLLVIKPAGAPGGVAATLRAAGEAFSDILITEPKAFDLVVEPTDREIVVRIQNRVALPLSGAVEVVLPPDAWPGSSSANAVEPWRHTFDVGPLEEFRAAFVWQGSGPARWYGVKAYGNGHVAYETVQ
jgi:hypothetical protein